LNPLAENPIAQALWHIETRLGEEMSLDDIAAAGGVSRFYISRAFTQVLARSVMGYVRARRLSEAARALAAGADDILSVALEAGYASHEAFTRAFRDQFGATPESVRTRKSTVGLNLLEPIRMNPQTAIKLDPPRLFDGESMLLAGLSERYLCGANAGIPGVWARFGPHIGVVPGQIPYVAFGAVYNTDDVGNFDYMACVEVRSFEDLPAEFTRLRVAPQRYAVFTHKGHISGIQATCRAIWTDWLPRSGHEPADAPFLERYDERFDPDTGNGEVDLWLAIKA